MAQPAGDPYWYYKVLGLHCVGSNGSTTFTDTGPSPKTVTANGNAQISTAQYPALTGKTSSAYFDGTGDYLSIPDSNDWNFGTGDFEFSILCYPTASGSDRDLIAHRNNAESDFWYVRQTSTDKVQVGAVVGGSVVTLVDSSDSLFIIAWNVITVRRLSGSVETGIGGTFGTTVTTDSSSAWPSASTSVLYIGVAHNGLSNPYSGYMSDIEIYKGAALHTANFTPPTVPFPNTYVQVSGVTKDAGGNFASRLVRVYRQDTGAFVGEQLSNGTTGEYVITAANTGATVTKHFAIMHDDDANPPTTSENAIIYDNITPY